MKKLNELYEKWLNETNKGHYKDNGTKELDVLSLFANQDTILLEISNLFGFYGAPLGGRVLDVGCSMGGLMYSLYNSNKFSYVAGIDVDQTAIDMAKRYKEIKGISDDELFVDTGSIFDLPFKDNTFDFIIMKDVGEHLESKDNLVLAMKELKRVLNKNGHIFIETPNYIFPMEVHLKIPMLPYIATKNSTKLIAKLFSKNPDFVNHLNFTTPKMFESIFKRLDLSFKNAYEEYKLPFIISNAEKLSGRFQFVGVFIQVFNKMGLGGVLIWLFKLSKMYPSLWYIVIKR